MTEKAPTGRNLEDIFRDLCLDLTKTDVSRHQVTAANDAEYARTTGADFFRVCTDGDRTALLTKNAGWALAVGMNASAVTTLCQGWNAYNEPPLDEAKIRETVASIARTHVRNHTREEIPDTPLFDLKAASVERFFGKPVPARDWVLLDCLPRGIVALIIGPGGTGKSQWALQLGYAIATGGDKYSPWKPGNAGQVLIICAEDDEDELHRRFERLLRADTIGSDGEQIFELLRKNLYIVPRVGEDNLFTRYEGNEVISTGWGELLARTVASLPNLRLIILDPLSRFRGGEENTAEDTTRFVVAMETLAKNTGAAVLGIHHANKASMQGGDQNQSASRGSSALTDGVRLQINLGYPSDKDQVRLGNVEPGKYLIAKITKTNYSAGGDQIYLRRDDEGRLLRIDPDVHQKGLDDAQMDRLVDVVHEGRTKKIGYSKSGFATAFGGRQGLFKLGQTALKQLIDRAIHAGRLEVEPGKANLLRPRDPVQKAKLLLPPTIVGN